MGMRVMLYSVCMCVYTRRLERAYRVKRSSAPPAEGATRIIMIYIQIYIYITILEMCRLVKHVIIIYTYVYVLDMYYYVT